MRRLVWLLLAMTSAAYAQDAARVGVENGEGTMLVAGTKTPWLARGFTTIAVLYPGMYASSMCKDLSAKEQAMLSNAQRRMVSHPEKEFEGMKSHWHANMIRFQVSQGALVYEAEHNVSAYTKMAANAINAARDAGLIVIVSMQTEGRGCTPMVAPDTLQKLPDTLTEKAWAQMLGAIKLDKRIVLEIFNEPDSRADCNHTRTGKAEQDKRGPLHWDGWEHGCGRSTHEGMVSLGAYVRKLAPDNVLIYDMDRNAESAEQSGNFKLPANSLFAVHPYVYTDGEAKWDERFGNTYAKGNNLITTEWNGGSSCASNKDATTMARKLVLEYLPARHAGMVLFSWDGNGHGGIVNPETYDVDSPHGPNAACKGGTIGMELFEQQSAN